MKLRACHNLVSSEGDGEDGEGNGAKGAEKSVGSIHVSGGLSHDLEFEDLVCILAINTNGLPPDASCAWDGQANPVRGILLWSFDLVIYGGLDELFSGDGVGVGHAEQSCMSNCLGANQTIWIGASPSDFDLVLEVG